jgi:hypothetical protein
MDFQDFSMTLDQQVCQDIVNQVKSPNFFTALRVPVADEIAYGQPYTLPLVRTTSNYPVMSLPNRMIYPDLNMPLELRQGASTWANLNLPSAPGMVWMAMGVKPDTVVSCPNIEDPEGFTMRTTLDLDLSGRPQGCANCKIEKYVCYKTGTGSLLEEASVGGGALGVGPASITVGDFTCLRAGETLLTRQSNWQLHNSINGLLLKPGEPIEIQYWVENDMETPLVLSLAPVSTLAGANLTIYPGQSGSPTLPDLAHPIVGSTITVPPLHDGTPGTFYLHIRGEVPENAAPEQYRYTLTLANSAANPTAWDGSTQIHRDRGWQFTRSCRFTAWCWAAGTRIAGPCSGGREPDLLSDRREHWRADSDEPHPDGYPASQYHFRFVRGWRYLPEQQWNHHLEPGGAWSRAGACGLAGCQGRRGNAAGRQDHQWRLQCADRPERIGHW